MRDAEAHVRRILDTTPVIVFAVDREGVYTLAEGQALRTLVPDPTVILGRSVDEVYPDAPEVGRCLRRALAGETFTAELEVRGTWWRNHYAPVLDERGEVVGAVGIGVDITERRALEEEAHRSAWFLDTVLESLPHMLFVKDAKDLRFVRFNRAGEELLGVPREELLGRTDLDLFPAEEAGFFQEKDREVLAAGRPIDIAAEPIHTRTHGTRYLNTRKVPIYGPSGGAEYLLGVSTDVTEHKQADEERQRLMERLQELDRLKDRLISNVSHELRTPLTLVLNAVERLSARLPPSGSEQRELAVIERSAQALLGQVDDLLEVSHAPDQRTLDYASVDLARRFRAATAPFQITAEDHHVHYVVESPDTLTAEVDPAKVERILANLLGNAFRFVRPGGTVRTTLAVRGDSAVLTVSDSGPGIPPDLRERVFERFFRGDDRPGGAGLGLTIVKDFAELHGGHIAVGTAPEGGASFVVQLPLRAPPGAWVRTDTQDARESAIRPALRAVPGGPPSPASLAAARARVAPVPEPSEDERPIVVLAEDNAELNRFLTEVLARDFHVRSAKDGEEALRLALETPPDLIVTDLMMPRMTGEELLAAVRKNPRLVGVQVLVITAWDDRALRVRLLREGAQDYVTKPFSTDELRARAANLVALKRTRDVLQRELESRRSDVESMARELGQRRRELEDALASTHAARQQAEEANRLRSEFLALLSHEMRTPVHALKLRRAVLERQLAPDDAILAQVRGVSASAERLYRLFDTLLDFARLERGPTHIERTPTDLAQLVRDLVDEIRPLAEEKGLSIALSAPEDLPPADSDATLVRIALANLLGNAVKFTPEQVNGRGAIHVRVEHDAQGHHVSVTDSGPGIPRESQERIFEPFVHLEPLRGKHVPGVGLGLPIARRLIEALGGSVTVTSTPGLGSTFSVHLPTESAVAPELPEVSASTG